MKKGILYTALAYIMWGFFPIYFKLIQNIPAIQIVAHRVIWSFIFLIFLILIQRKLGDLRQNLKPRIILIYLCAGVLLAGNWLTYVWSVNAGYVLEASLGYFINPLVSILLGTIFLREKLRLLQWVPIGLAAIGVTYLTISYGALPWIALILAFSFAFYGLVKKVAPLNSLNGLTLETAVLLLPALGYLIYCAADGTGAFIAAGWGQTILLSLAGIITAVPLLLFSSGARRIPLTMVGLLQYFSPTLQFLLGVLLYHESFTQARIVGFCIIWLALIVFTVEGFLFRRKQATNHTVVVDAPI